MINYTLHKLPEGFIVTSDEKDTVGYLPIVLTKFNELEQTADGDDVYHHIKYGSKIVIAQQDQIDFSALSEEEQKEIGLFDIESILDKEYHNIDLCYSDFKIYEKGYRNAFKKVQELLSDRLFTLEEVNKIFEFACKNCKDEDESFKDTFERAIQCLSQPKSWKVDIIQDGNKVTITKIYGKD